MLKKANIAMQGYQKRWVSLSKNGLLSYFRIPPKPTLTPERATAEHSQKDRGGSVHGSVWIRDCAVRCDHDNLLIDIDSGKSIYHFKLDSAAEFENWMSAIQKYLPSNAMIDFETQVSNEISAFRVDVSSQSLDDPGESFETTYTALTVLLSSLEIHVASLRTQMETGSHRKKSENTLIAAGLSTFTTHIAAVSAKLGLLRDVREYETKNYKNLALKNESAFYSVLNECNRLKERVKVVGGSETNLYMSDCLPMNSAPVLQRQMTDAGSIGHRSFRVKSTGSNGEIYYDANEAESTAFEYSSDEYSLHEDEGNGGFDSTVSVFRDDPEPGFPENENNALLDVSIENVNLLPLLTGRMRLPAPTSSIESVSLIGILRTNVGKDLSTIAMPVVLNEPINLLQRIAEELEYYQLLEQADLETDAVARMCLIAGFVVSGYASSLHRATRKPFNPLLGETYELETKGFKYISEKVTHHPPVMACHATSPHFVFTQDSCMKTKFWGKSMELNNLGTTKVVLSSGESFSWNKVTTSMRNVFSNTRYLEHHGTLKIASSTGVTCQLTFKESGYFTSANNEVIGEVYRTPGNNLASLW